MLLCCSRYPQQNLRAEQNHGLLRHTTSYKDLLPWYHQAFSKRTGTCSFSVAKSGSYIVTVNGLPKIIVIN
ncbi:MAG: hypothetical protein II663_06825 [Bacteroidales bacterium]|nr:hypothetical protein [Bacteroidales bacterium]